VSRRASPPLLVFFTNSQRSFDPAIIFVYCLMPSSRRYDITFFTSTVLEWKFLLTNDLYKDIIIDSLKYLVEKERVMVHAFAIMNNHLHLLWHIRHPHAKDDVQRDFQKFTSQIILKDLRNNHVQLLQEFYVGAKDRKHQVWERNPLSIGIWSEEVLRQKLEYIHNNPVKAGLCAFPEDYLYSTARLYNGDLNQWKFVTPLYF
jgi:putative transposase